VSLQSGKLMTTSLKSLCASNEGKYEKFVRQSVGNLIARYVWSIPCMYECIYYAFELQMQCIMRRYIIHILLPLHNVCM
jgi:hypothetical protein